MPWPLWPRSVGRGGEQKRCRAGQRMYAMSRFRPNFAEFDDLANPAASDRALLDHGSGPKRAG